MIRNFTKKKYVAARSPRSTPKALNPYHLPLNLQLDFQLDYFFSFLS